MLAHPTTDRLMLTDKRWDLARLLRSALTCIDSWASQLPPGAARERIEHRALYVREVDGP